MSYRKAMEQAGATIHEFKEFGSYQGDWYALVTWNGEKGWINGSYGSCSGCDAFEGEFGYDDDGCEDHRYHKRPDCAACVERGEKYRKHLAEFGKGYLETLLTQEQAEANAAKAAEWSMEDKEALDWLREHRIPNARLDRQEEAQHNQKGSTSRQTNQNAASEGTGESPCSAQEWLEAMPEGRGLLVTPYLRWRDGKLWQWWDSQYVGMNGCWLLVGTQNTKAEDQQ